LLTLLNKTVNEHLLQLCVLYCFIDGSWLVLELENIDGLGWVGLKSFKWQMGWVGLGSKILGWVGLGFQKVTHVQLWAVTPPNLLNFLLDPKRHFFTSEHAF
jgi:hypothetical protein